MGRELRGVVWYESRYLVFTSSLVSAVLLSSGHCPTCAIMPVLSWTLMLLLFVAGTYTCTSVAPQDANSFCLNLPNRPETNPRQVILLDTANYRGQDLVTIIGQSRMWISLKLLPGHSNQKVRLPLRMHACLVYTYVYCVINSWYRAGTGCLYSLDWTTGLTF